MRSSGSPSPAPTRDDRGETRPPAGTSRSPARCPPGLWLAARAGDEIVNRLIKPAITNQASDVRDDVLDVHRRRPPLAGCGGVDVISERPWEVSPMPIIRCGITTRAARADMHGGCSEHDGYCRRIIGCSWHPQRALEGALGLESPRYGARKLGHRGEAPASAPYRRFEDGPDRPRLRGIRREIGHRVANDRVPRNGAYPDGRRTRRWSCIGRENRTSRREQLRAPMARRGRPPVSWTAGFGCAVCDRPPDVGGRHTWSVEPSTGWCQGGRDGSKRRAESCASQSRRGARWCGLGTWLDGLPEMSAYRSFVWSRRRDSGPRPSPWRGRVEVQLKRTVVSWSRAAIFARPSSVIGWAWSASGRARGGLVDHSRCRRLRGRRGRGLLTGRRRLGLSASASASGSSASGSSEGPHSDRRSACAASRSSRVRCAPAQGGGPVQGSPSVSGRGVPRWPLLSRLPRSGLPQSECAAASTSPPAASTAATYSPWLR